MENYFGEGVVRYFDEELANKYIHKGEGVVWTSTMLNRSTC